MAPAPEQNEPIPAPEQNEQVPALEQNESAPMQEQSSPVQEQTAKKKRKREQVDYEALLMANMPIGVRQRRPFATLALASVSVLVAIAMLCATGSFNPDPEIYIRAGAEYRPLILEGQLWRLVTGTFLHFGLQHLLFNMLCLYALGRFLEKVAGHANLLCVYLLTACTGGLLSMAFHDRTVCAGASGAVFGIFGASISLIALLWRKYNIDPKHMWGYMKNGLAFVGINFIYSLFPGIDMAGHIGGLLGGLAVGAVVAVPLLMDGKPFAKWFQRGFWGVSALLAVILVCTTACGVSSRRYGGGSSSSDSGSSYTTNTRSSTSWLTKDDVDKVRSDAEQGDAAAQYKLGCCYVNGEGVTQNLPEAIRWFRKAAEQGNAEAQNDLGVYYVNGLGVERNPSMAFNWIHKAAMQGIADAQHNLAFLYEEGLGVEKDEQEALNWYLEAAKQGLPSAQNNAGSCYQHGRGVAQNTDTAVFWYRKAAEKGYALSQYNLGFCYKEGVGVTKDMQEAARWFRKAAEQGNAEAQKELGLCYMGGQGVKRDWTEAHKWFRKAAEQGNKGAANLLKNLEDLQKL